MTAHEMWIDLEEEERLAAGDRGLTLEEASARCRQGRNEKRALIPSFSIENARRTQLERQLQRGGSAVTESARKGDWCQTFLGVQFWTIDPRAEDVRAEDIAHALSLLCRFGGHCSEFYSVAEHSIRVSHIVPREHALVALLHDAAEAYVIDLPRPIKRSLPGYAEAEERVARAISDYFGIDVVHLPPEVKHADQVMLATEKRDLMPNVPKPWENLPPPLEAPIVPLPWRQAKAAFQLRLEVLLADRARWSELPTMPDGGAADDESIRLVGSAEWRARNG